MVANTRTMCTALPAQGVEVALRDDISVNAIVDVHLQGASRYWECELVLSGTAEDDRIFEATHHWPISICPQGQEGIDNLPQDLPIMAKLRAQDPRIPTYEDSDRWESFVLLNSTEMNLGTLMEDAEEHNSSAKEPWEDLRLKSEGLWSTVYDANDKALFKASLCWYNTQPPEVFDVTMSGQPIFQEPKWERRGDNVDIQHQLGVGVSLEDFQERGILDLQLGDLQPRDLDRESVHQEWYNMGLVHVLAERPRESAKAWSLASWRDISAHVSHTSTFQSLIKITNDPAIAVQSLISLLHKMHYYEIMDMFELQSRVTTIHSAELLVPARWTGLIIVLSFTMLHLVALFSTMTLFILKTEISALGNTWQTVAQASGAAKELPQAHRALDKEIEGWSKATGRDQTVWALQRGGVGSTEDKVEVRSEEAERLS